jgi:hypothetical protein
MSELGCDRLITDGGCTLDLDGLHPCVYRAGGAVAEVEVEVEHSTVQCAAPALRSAHMVGGLCTKESRESCGAGGAGALHHFSTLSRFCRLPLTVGN